MIYVIDGIEYPDVYDRIATLREDRSYWKLLAMELSRQPNRSA